MCIVQVREGMGEMKGKQQISQLRGRYTPLWEKGELEKLSGLWTYQTKPSTWWTEWELPFLSVGVGCWTARHCLMCWVSKHCGKTKENLRLHSWTLDHHDFPGRLQSPHIAGENVIIFLLTAKLTRCDFSHPSNCLSALTATGSPFPNIKLSYSHGISAGVHYTTKHIRLGINLHPRRI